MKHIRYLHVLAGGLLACAVASARPMPQNPLEYARGLAVSRFDPTLPDVDFGVWIETLAGDSSVVHWTVTDCRAPLGKPFVDASRKGPACVIIRMDFPSKRAVGMAMSMGSDSTGSWEDPRISNIYIEETGISRPLKRLGEVPTMIRETN